MQIIIGKDFSKKVIPLIEQAKNSINIVVFDWRWYFNDPGCPAQLFNQSLLRASRRGVKVQAVVNGGEIIKTLNDLGIASKGIAMKSLVHAKLMIIDNLIVVLGSHNYTQNAFTVNQEISVILDVSQNPDEFYQFFKSLWEN